MNKYFLFYIIFFLCITLCKAQDAAETKNDYPNVHSLIDSIRMQYAPDKRESVFEISISDVNNQPQLNGVTSVPKAKSILINRAKIIYPELIDSIKLLPSADLGENIYGVVNVSVADMRVHPDFEYEMATQALLGTPIKLLQSKAGWYRVQTPDGYIAWMHNMSFSPKTEEEIINWQTLENKIIFTDYFGFAYAEPDIKSQHIGDLTVGNMLNIVADEAEFYKVAYPDNRIAYVKKSQSERYPLWKESIRITRESIIDKASALMGIPYTWGGTSTKGVDCSGFTKMVFLMHNIILMRDASQQAYTGIQVDISNMDNLQVGDLIFFGKKGEQGKKDRIRHVGIYLGNKEFIHASGYVRINSLDVSQPHYDEKNATELIRATRILGAIDTNGIWHIYNNPFYKNLTPANN